MSAREVVDLAGGLTAIGVDASSGGAAWITLNRPEAANARNQQMREELMAVYAVVAGSDDILVVVLTGAGERHFCAGMDLREAGEPETPLQRAERLGAARDIEALAHIPQPTIAAINGAAFGGGLEMALACDLRLAADDARLALPEVGHGLIPGGGGTQRLPRLIGVSRALEMLYRGTVVSGQEAARIGLATASVPRAELRPAVERLVDELVGRPQRALRAVKKLVLRGLEGPFSAGIEAELETLLLLLADRTATLA